MPVIVHDHIHLRHTRNRVVQLDAEQTLLGKVVPMVVAFAAAFITVIFRLRRTASTRKAENRQSRKQDRAPSHHAWVASFQPQTK